MAQGFLMKESRISRSVAVGFMFWALAGIPFCMFPNHSSWRLLGMGCLFKSRQNTPPQWSMNRWGMNAAIFFHPCFLSVFHESFLKFLSRSWHNDINKRRFYNMKSYRTYSSILSANHPQNPRLSALHIVLKSVQRCFVLYKKCVQCFHQIK